MEVGSAGASCIDGSIIVSDILPGIGAIHTQSFWDQSNQNNAHEWMENGHTAQE
ncbi:MAG: secretion protein, partial [Candidatus Marinimicrobia bacterium]|nr:secretion protein [Candidatus Neomarinimicrobiota bacterium]